MKIPDFAAEAKGDTLSYDNILILLKCIYGLFQAARQCFKTFVQTLILKTGYNQSHSDPCMMMHIHELLRVIIII